jgi:general secretion pathway protein D
MHVRTILMGRKTVFLLIIAVTLTLLVCGPARSARLSRTGDEPSQGENYIMDFRDVDIRVVARFIGEITGQNFIFDKNVRDKVTVYSPTQVSADEAFRLFETVLKVHNLTTIPSNDVTKIVPSQKARTMDIETRAEPPTGLKARQDRIVTQLIRLKYANPTEMRTLLNPLVDKQSGSVMAYDSGNTLILTDYASNIDRLMTIIAQVDVSDEGTSLTVIPLKYASARDLARELTEVLQVAPIKGRPPQRQVRQGMDYKVVADERTNTLIVMARPGETRIIRDMARRLDTPQRRGHNRVHVYFLENAVAEELAEVLNELAGQTANTTNQQEGTSRAPTPVLLQEPVFITAEPSTNALIIRAEQQDYIVLQDIIHKLDIQRAQVLVEGIIMEMTLNKASALGAEWRLLDSSLNSTDRTALGGTNLPAGSSTGIINQLATQPFAGPAGLVLGAAEGTLTFGGKTFLNIGLLVQALQQDTDVNILSTPHLLTMDNQEARIVVGEERPFLQSSLSTATGATSPSVTNTYEFKDLGLTLVITPHITQGEYIKLSIFQQLKSFVGEAETGAVTSTKREAETTVLVRNGETVVIGGLISDTRRENKAQVPCLGDIPLLGWAFKRRTQSGDKQNLMILIKPTIIRSAKELREETDRKKKEMEESTKPPPKGEEYPPEGLDMLKD